MDRGVDCHQSHWRKVMERRNLLAGLAVLVLSLFAADGYRVRACCPPQEGQAAHATGRAPRKPAWFTRCPRPSWTRASSAPRRASPTSSKSSAKKSTPRRTCAISANELYSRCDQNLYWATPATTTDARCTTRAEHDGDARQRRQRDGHRVRRALVRGGRKPDRGPPGRGSVHDGRRPPSRCCRRGRPNRA